MVAESNQRAVNETMRVSWSKPKVSGSVWFRLILLGCLALCNAGCSPDNGIPLSGNRAYRSHRSLIETQNVGPCSLGKNSPFGPCESRRHIPVETFRIDREIALLIQPRSGQLEARADRESGNDVNKLSKLPVGLLSVIGGSIVTVIVFAESQARYASKMVRRRTGLFDHQTSQSLIKALLAGLTATTLLFLAEVSIRCVL